MPELTGRCPICEAELVVTHLRCQRCGTGLEGTFTLNKFDRLSREQLRFVDVFIKNRGVIRDVERELGISYPTVRSRLDEVIRSLGYDADGEPAAPAAPAGGAAGAAPAAPAGGVSPERRREILDRLSSGAIGADLAVKLLRGEPEPAEPAGSAEPAEPAGSSQAADA
jgi:hypothetical protein